jgi:hypothetical protein
MLHAQDRQTEVILYNRKPCRFKHVSMQTLSMAYVNNKTPVVISSRLVWVDFNFDVNWLAYKTSLYVAVRQIRVPTRTI